MIADDRQPTQQTAAEHDIDPLIDPPIVAPIGPAVVPPAQMELVLPLLNLEILDDFMLMFPEAIISLPVPAAGDGPIDYHVPLPVPLTLSVPVPYHANNIFHPQQ